MLNELEVLHALEPLGFVGVDTADLNFSEKASTFDEARVVIGCIGAGLGNIVFCRPGTFLLQLAGSTITDSIYIRLATIMKINHATLNFSSSPIMEDNKYMWVDRSFYVDVPKVVETVKKLLAHINI
jgi:capsular polysaccharide biosynthesis protein